MILTKGNNFEFTPTVEDWNNFLEKWNTAIFENLDKEHLDNYQNEFSEALESKCCLWEGATEDDISELEDRLKTRLPLSYKSFLLASNGFTILNRYCELYGTDQIKWFIEGNKEWAEIWSGDEDRIDEEWAEIWGIDYDDENIGNTEHFLDESQHIKSTLQISTSRDGDVFLLNPKIIDSRNEWEAWDFGNKNPGAYRYKSFWDMMQDLYSKSFGS
ncbi:Cell wall assembly/cell proliferation coordinating protein, KNR4 [Tumidithrix helvetica PCC 7403]|uniref:SMI1/KNR4 family protein n=1 Tax=Tumidithrix helvetica TaxID=3457545 RepID=UPI003CAE8364